MAEYIACRQCDSPDCKGCNLKRLETMLENGKFDCLMNENRCINPSADVAPVKHGKWVLGNVEPGYFTPGGNRPWICSDCGWLASYMLGKPNERYCPSCGARMDGEQNA